MLGLNIAYPNAKFDYFSISHSRDMVDAHQNLNDSRDLTSDHAPFRDGLLSAGCANCYGQPIYQIKSL